MNILNKKKNISKIISEKIKETNKMNKESIIKEIVKIKECPPNRCPYKPKKVLTEKQAKQEPLGSFYHPTEETYRSGACNIGYILKKGYERKAYIKKDGTYIKATYVDPICIKDKGLKGKVLEEYKPIHLSEKGELKPFGYNTKLKKEERLDCLIKASEKLTFKSVLGRINALRILNKNFPKYFKIYDEDYKNLKLFQSLFLLGYDLKASNDKRFKSLQDIIQNITLEKLFSKLKKLKKIYNNSDSFIKEILELDIHKLKKQI